MAYLAPIHRPSSVKKAIKLSFLSSDSQDLIVAKANRLEIWSSNPKDPSDPTLVLQHTKALYGRVTLLHKLRPATSQTDHLFVGTDRYHYFTLSWNPVDNSLKTEKKYVDIAEKAARDSQTGDRVHIDPTARFMALECYEGVVNVIPIAHAGKGKRKAVDNEIGELGEPIPVRISELFVRSSCFLHKRQAGAKVPDPEFAVMHEDSQNKVRIKIRKLEYSPSLRPGEEPAVAELEGEKEVHGQIELGATFMIPLPPPIYGFLIVCDTSISYVDEFDYHVRNTEPLDDATVFVAWCQLDDIRYVLADDYGKLYLLMVQQTANGEYEGHQIEILGETSRASTLVYLDEGRVFVGSHQGDSQIIQISPQHIEVVQTFSNIAPILDFTIMDMGNRGSDAPVNEFSSGQARIVTGSGAFKDGSLRSVRSGVGLEDRADLGSLNAPISSVFGLVSNAGIRAMDTLLVSFVDHTRVFVFDQSGEVEERDEYRGFSLAENTLHASNLLDGRAVQVTRSSVLMTDADGGMVTDSWRAPAGAFITAVSVADTYAVISLSGKVLVVLDLSGSSIVVLSQREFGIDEEVSCIALSSSAPNVCVAGFWKDSRVSFLDLQSLQPIATEKVADDVLAVPRSLAIANILPGQPATLFVGLADGNVVTYTIESPRKPFAARKSIILGTQQANFAVLPRGDGLQNVFATCEHPSLIYGSEGRMVYSAVTAESATCICSFNSFEPYGNAVAIASNDELRIAVVDEERTTHVQELSIHETVRRITYSSNLKAFGLGCIKRTLIAGAEEVVSHFKLVDEIAFKELDSYELKEEELIECVMRCQLDDGTGDLAERFIVGTAFLDDDESNKTNGRILILEVTADRRLKLVGEVGLKGACRCLAMCQGKIVAGLIKTVVVFAIEQNSFAKKAVYRTSTAPIDMTVTDNIIAVTDLMKSMSLVEYRPGDAGLPDTLVEVARHYQTLWGTAVANVADNTYLEADAEGNLIVLQRDVNGFSEEDRRRLTPTSEILLGEMVNRIRRIDVTPSPGAVVIPRAFLATVDGSIYLFALIAPGKQDLLMRMQAKMAQMVRSPGEIEFNKFRGFKNEVRDESAAGPTRFVDGELVERFLDLSDELQEVVVKGLDVEGVEEMRGIVEGLRRIH